jgi:hypothetical protein
VRRQQLGELSDRALAQACQAALDRLLNRLREPRPAPAAGDHDLAADVAGHARGLVRGAVAHALADVVVELVDRDRAVPVHVGLAGREPLDEAAREERAGHGGVELVDPGRRVGGLEGVLELGRRRQGHAPAALEAVLDVDRQRALGRQPLPERAAVAAVEDEDDRARAAVLHDVVDEAVLDRGGPQEVQRRRGRREVEPPALRQHPVAGEVEEQQVVAPRVAEEALDLLLEVLGRPVDQPADLELADRAVLEHRGERVDVAGRRAQPGQPGIGVGAGRDQQRAAAAGGRLRLRRAWQGTPP